MTSRSKLFTMSNKVEVKPNPFDLVLAAAGFTVLAPICLAAVAVVAGVLFRIFLWAAGYGW